MLNVIDIYEYFLASGYDKKTLFDMLEELCPDEFTISKFDDGSSYKDFGLLLETNKICEKMCEDSFLMKTTSQVFAGGNKYIGVEARNGKSREALANNIFDCKYKGFAYTRTLCQDSVRPIVGVNKNNDPDIGTVFKVSANVYATARHCIEDLKNFDILDADENPIALREIIYSNNKDIDIALVVTDNEAPGRIFPLATPEMLEDVLVMGYPPISGMFPVLISEKGQITATMKSTIGANVGETKDYLRGLDCFLISARVKGGSSGSPVINQYGMVTGIVVSLPMDTKNPDRIDLLGYGACLPSSYIESMINGENINIVPVENK